MFYFLSKVISYLLTSAGLLTVVLVLALLIRKPGWSRRLLALGLGLWWLLGAGFVSNELALWWEVPERPLAPAGKPRLGIVLTGGMVQTDRPPFDRIHLGDQADRLAQALLLYKAGTIQKILISGGIGLIIPREQADEGKLAARFLMAAGVPASDIVLENRSRNTYENARFTAPILKKQFPGNDYVLITAASHQRRALACFRRQGITAIPYPAAYIGQQRRWTPGQFLPTEHGLRDTYTLLHVLVGYWMYWGVGYL